MTLRFLNPDVVTHRVTSRTPDDVAHAKARVMHHNRKSGSQEITGHSAQQVLVAKSAGPRAAGSKSRYDIAVSVSEWPDASDFSATRRPTIHVQSKAKRIAEHPHFIRETDSKRVKKPTGEATLSETRRGAHDGEQKHTSR